MTKKEKEVSSKASIAKAAAAIAFALTLGVTMSFLHTGEEDTTTKAFAAQFDKFKRHIVASHWQWRVHPSTTMIMLIHFDESGSEINRTPVRMNHDGWPSYESSDLGCEKTWKALVAAPLRVDGFKVNARYYAELDEGEDNYWCRFSLSSGSYFDYFPASGTATNLTQ
ncbi:hypothetical protein KUL156_19450 [Alteromonas sp. KUL156]|uniref:hypothetical protein n=1 Tax=Alteromonas sp. KUL106 TaxID=2480799 RepID=UPI0012E504A7|nr:hypothetical protein [Alteromonas sp. KUL106]GFD70300.1 hypothetical protein KUL106_35630 [Alteromonas sp. KUL106]GFD79626.1 hypothetical protein KUL118_24880 [Tenacibaculum sp. KUL118]GFD93740.1 hypothetical protein KUL154_24730 [Alteromonas sp. KUL154]GFD99352.1 hypothetical protein KUL156_19450 [Alteromonas sp. KUL156]